MHLFVFYFLPQTNKKIGILGSLKSQELGLIININICVISDNLLRALR